MLSEHAKAIIAWVNVCVLWGTTYLAIRIGVEHLPPMLFAGIRWVTAGAVFVAVLKWRGTPLPGPGDLIHLAVVGLALLGFANGLVVWAEQWIPSGLTALLLTTMPFVSAGLEAMVPKGQRLNATTLAGLVLGLAGVCLIFREDIQYLTDRDNLAGILGLAGAVFFWTLGSLYSKHVKIEVAPLMGAAVQMLIAGVFLSLFGVSIGELPRLEFEINGVLSLAYLVVFGSLLGYSSYIYALAKLPLSFVSTFAYINPVIALVLGWAVLDEKLNLQIAVAAAVVMAGVFLVKRGTIGLKPTA
jgi:drug/metabolite transporter (DMT)-like permease